MTQHSFEKSELGVFFIGLTLVGELASGGYSPLAGEGGRGAIRSEVPAFQLAVVPTWNTDTDTHTQSGEYAYHPYLVVFPELRP